MAFNSQSNTVAAALLANTAVKALVGTRVYQEQPPATAAFPCLAFAESQATAGSADNAVFANAVTFDIDAFATGSAWPLAEATITCMAGIGYTCTAAQSAGMVGDGTIHQVSMTFKQTKEV